MKKLFRLISTTVLLQYCSISAAIGIKNDFQIWNNITVMGTIKDQIKYWAEGQARFGQDASMLSQSIVRPGIGYQLTKESSIWAGYAWIYTNQPFAPTTTHENRIWQQFLWVKNYEWIKVFSRTRLEQRFVDRVSSVGWRLRQFGRLQMPFKKAPKFFLSSMEEVFIRLNNTANNGNNSGFDQNRLFFGIGVTPTKNWLLEVGYQNHIIRILNGPNYQGNYLAMNLIGNFT